jgi:hypothetical protein
MSGPCRRWHPAPVSDEGRARARVVSLLVDRFPEVGERAIEAHVDAAWTELGEARVRDFVPVLVTRTVDEQLRQSREA